MLRGFITAGKCVFASLAIVVMLEGCAANSRNVSEVPPPRAPESYPSPTEKPTYNPEPVATPQGVSASSTRPVIYDYPGRTQKIGATAPEHQSTAVAPVPKESVRTSTAPASSAGKSYTVQPGDTLWRIANKSGASVQAIKQLNGLNSDVIHAGQVLQLP